jgi:hypothetical protein
LARARAVPHWVRAFGSSDSASVGARLPLAFAASITSFAAFIRSARGMTESSLFSNFGVMTSGSTSSSSPFGPFALIFCPLTETVAPAGMVIASFPIRDIELAS